MNWTEIEGMARSIGWPATVVFIVALILMRNGWWKITIRGEAEDEITRIGQELTTLQSSHKALAESVEKIEKVQKSIEQHVEDLKVLAGRLDERTKK